MADATPGLTLHELKPAEGSHRERKRIGRGHGSGSGKTAGRGQKGQKSRSGSHSMRPGFEGGQMPLYMRLGKLRGPNHKKSMPMGPFRTHTTPVNVASLERFDAGVEVTPELLRSAGVVRSLKHPIKILGKGELTTQPHRHRARVLEARGRADRGGRRQGRAGRRHPRGAGASQGEAQGQEARAQGGGRAGARGSRGRSRGRG